MRAWCFFKCSVVGNFSCFQFCLLQALLLWRIFYSVYLQGGSLGRRWHWGVCVSRWVFSTSVVHTLGLWICFPTTLVSSSGGWTSQRWWQGWFFLKPFSWMGKQPSPCSLCPHMVVPLCWLVLLVSLKNGIRIDSCYLKALQFCFLFIFLCDMR